MSDEEVGIAKALSGAIEKLVDVVGAGLGRVYEPSHIRRMAKANADASLINAESELRIAALRNNALIRIEHVEVRRQQNLEAIADIAIESMAGEPASAKPVDFDWIAAFFESAQDIGAEDMQRLLAEILAGEVRSPGSFGHRCLALVKELDRYELALFTELCGCCLWMSGEPIPFIPFASSPTLASIGLMHGGLLTLKSAGLVELTVGPDIQVFRGFTADSKAMLLDSDGAGYSVSGRAGQRLPTGCVDFTRAGLELARVIRAPANKEHIASAVGMLRGAGLTVEAIVVPSPPPPGR